MLDVLTKARIRLRGRSLDRRLAGGEDPASSAELAHRAAWLTRARQRRSLARSIRSVRELGSRGRVPITSAIPPDWAELTSNRLKLARIESVLDLVETPVYSRGVAMAQVLLTEGLSPLYYPKHKGELREALDEILVALEGR